MTTSKPITLRNPGTRFDLIGDRDMFNRIVRDMLEHGGDLAPSNHWNWNLGKGQAGEAQSHSGYTDELFDEQYSKLDMMLNPWVGVTGMKPIDDAAVEKYERFLRAIDHLAILPDDIMTHGRANDWRETDLGTILDVNLVTAHRPDLTASRRLRICEVGGGYGRLAEVMLGSLPSRSHYVLLDAVPGSLMYAYLYLKRQLPELRIGSYYLNDAYSDAFDCYIMPAWQAHQLPSEAFDLCINIESLQEMEQHHVDHYIALFDRLAATDALLYLSNARDYVFKGQWRFPNDWEILYFNNTPRSWTADHPTQIFRKGAGDHSAALRVAEAAFAQQVTDWRNRQLVSELRQSLAERDQQCDERRGEIDRLTTEIESSRKRWPGSWLRPFRH